MSLPSLKNYIKHVEKLEREFGSELNEQSMFGRADPALGITKGAGSSGGGIGSSGGGGLKGGTTIAPRSSAETQQAYAQAAQAAKAAQSGSTASTSTAPVSTATTTKAVQPAPSTPPATVNSGVMRNFRTGQPLLPPPPSNVPQYTLNPQYNKTQSLDISPRDVLGGRSITPSTSNIPGAGKIAATTAGTTAATTAGMMAANRPGSPPQAQGTNGSSKVTPQTPTNTSAIQPSQTSQPLPPGVTPSTAGSGRSSGPGGNVVTPKPQTFSKGVTDIANLNKIADPNFIRVGQTLNLPGQDTPYTVKAGDTLSGIAARQSAQNAQASPSASAASSTAQPDTAEYGGSLEEQGAEEKSVRHMKKDNKSQAHLTESVLDEKLERIFNSHPHEHKACQEGWGMAESLYQALCDHYWHEGRIPKEIMHGDRQALRDFVEECYVQDTQKLFEEPLEEVDTTRIPAVRRRELGQPAPTLSDLGTTDMWRVGSKTFTKQETDFARRYAEVSRLPLEKIGESQMQAELDSNIQEMETAMSENTEKIIRTGSLAEQIAKIRAKMDALNEEQGVAGGNDTGFEKGDIIKIHDGMQGKHGGMQGKIVGFQDGALSVDFGSPHGPMLVNIKDAELVSQGVAEGLFGFGDKSKSQPDSPAKHLVSLNRKKTFSDREPSSEERQLYDYLENKYYNNKLADALQRLSVGQIVSYYDMIYPKSSQAWKEYSNINDIIDKGRKEYATGLPRRAYDFLTLKKEAEEKERRWRGYEDRLETCKNELKRREQYNQSNQQGVAEGSGSDLERILAAHREAVENFKQGGALDYDLESDLWDYYFNKGEIRNYDADASEFISQRLADELGLSEGMWDRFTSSPFGQKTLDTVASALDTLAGNRGSGSKTGQTFGKGQVTPGGPMGPIARYQNRNKNEGVAEGIGDELDRDPKKHQKHIEDVEKQIRAAQWEDSSESELPVAYANMKQARGWYDIPKGTFVYWFKKENPSNPKDPYAILWIPKHNTIYVHSEGRTGRFRTYLPDDLKLVISQGPKQGVAEGEGVYRHKGTYGTSYDSDDTEKEKPAVKRGRGRPSLKQTSGGPEFSPAAKSFFGIPGKPFKAKDLPGKASVKHKIKENDVQMESWDQQLHGLLNEGMTVTTSTGNEGASDSVSVSATDADAQTLMKMLQNSGMLHGKSTAMSSPAADDMATGTVTVEPVSADEVMGTLEPQGDDHGEEAMGFLKRMLGARHGEESSADADYAQEKGAESDEEACETCGHAECECDHEEEQVDEMDNYEQTQHASSDHTMSPLSKAGTNEELKGGQTKLDKAPPFGKLTGADFAALRKDKTNEEDLEEEALDQPATMEEKRCDECGGVMEADHQCEGSHDKLDEWANSPAGKSADEQFLADISYMTKSLSGGLNGMKQDQTTLPSTKVKTEAEANIADVLRKLQNIN